MKSDEPHEKERTTPDVSGVHNPEVSHEVSDVSVKGIAWFGLALFLLIGVVCVLMWWLLVGFEHSEIASEPRPASRIEESEPRLPPEPRLQGAPGHEALPQVDMKELRQNEDAALTSYGWVDRQNGVARIPIERAKQLLVQTGLPSSPEKTTKQEDGADSGKTPPPQSKSAAR